MYKLYFDCGARHTRGYLTDGKKLLEKSVRKVGSQDVVLSGSNSCLISAICGITWEIKKRRQLNDNEVEVFASGIASSSYGLREVPHLALPIPISDLADHMTDYRMYTGATKLIRLIPGIKSMPGPAEINNIEHINHVRGEEICAIGARSMLGEEYKDKKILFLVPRSHTHLIDFDGETISRVFSTFTGEFYNAIKSQSTLTDSFADIATVDEELFAKGMEVSTKYGINKALYTINTARLFRIMSAEQLTSYFFGMVYGDVAKYINRIFDKGYTSAEYLVICAEGLDGSIYSAVAKHILAPLKIIDLPPIEADYAFMGFLEVLQRMK